MLKIIESYKSIGNHRENKNHAGTSEISATHIPASGPHLSCNTDTSSTEWPRKNCAKFNAPWFYNRCLYNTSRRYLRLATHGDLLVPRTRTATYGPRSFAVSGPTVWNTLPSTLRVSTTTRGQFQSGVKAILFRLAYGTWSGAFMTV